MNTINDYIELIRAPWGKMFYDLLFKQLSVPHTPSIKILDFGSGLGVTSDHFAAWHNVTAVEPNEEMILNSRRENLYTQLHGSVEKIAMFKDYTFDLVLCHNVLEYIEEKEPIFAELFRVIKPGGTLSIVKHNRAGKVFQAAVFENNPAKALSLLNPHTQGNSNFLGTQQLYSNSDLAGWAEKYGGTVRKVLGMRAFWVLGQDNAVKYADEWHQKMLTLERKAAEIDEYKQSAYYNHLLIVKED